MGLSFWVLLLKGHNRPIELLRGINKGAYMSSYSFRLMQHIIKNWYYGLGLGLFTGEWRDRSDNDAFIIERGGECPTVR